METLFIIKQDGICDLRGLWQWFTQALDGHYRVEIKRVRRKRTLEQNGWLFGCIYPMLLKALNDAGWDDITTVEQVHEYFKSLLWKQRIVNRHTGEIVEIPYSTTEMDTVQFSTYCEKLRDYGREFLGIEIPDPDKHHGMEIEEESDNQHSEL